MYKRLLLGLGVLCAFASAADNASLADRGKYLTEEVAKCQDCHTPRGDKGEPGRAKWLKGAVLDFAPVGTVPNWHKTAPDITSGGRLWERWGEAGLIKFLMTGKGPKGNAADPPMPPYTLKQEDAEAIVAYLKTLK